MQQTCVSVPVSAHAKRNYFPRQRHEKAMEREPEKWKIIMISHTGNGFILLKLVLYLRKKEKPDTHTPLSQMRRRKQG